MQGLAGWEEPLLDYGYAFFSKQGSGSRIKVSP
jgi:hypothetical protein